MLGPFVLAVAAAAPLASAATSISFPFDATFSGVAGAITVTWDSPKYSGAKVAADLRFDRMDMKELKAFDGNCTGPVTEYTWHIHTQWNMPPGRLSTSAMFKGCVKAITGNHYDPYKICGPASEYVDTPACAPKVKDYKCTPDEYKKNFAACESGDLSGKFGTLKPNKQGVVKAEWYDQRFPFFSEVGKWNIVIHAVCGKATPRVSCGGVQVSSSARHHKKSVVKEEEEEEEEENDDDDDEEKDDKDDKDGKDDEGEDDEDGENDEDENDEGGDVNTSGTKIRVHIRTRGDAN